MWKCFFLALFSFTLSSQNAYGECTTATWQQVESYAQKQTGPVHFIFFSSWCESCRPEVAALAKDKSPGTKILINTYDHEGRAAPILQRMGVSNVCFFDADHEIAKHFSVRMCPRTIIYDNKKS